MSWADFLDVQDDLDTAGSLRGRRVLITGAGGSIGSALAEAAVREDAALLVLLDASESALYEIDRNLREQRSHCHIPIVGSVLDQNLLAKVFATHALETVLHAAAMKHVPLMEHNPLAAVSTNVGGTLRVFEAALEAGCGHFVLLSTDKAADPISIMGASKRVAEMLLLSQSKDAPMQIAAVRLGNVIGSQGSVLPLMRQQIEQGEPVTVTSPEARRYFMTMADAVKAILSALDCPLSPALLVPQIGPPRSILALAQHLVATSTSSPPISFTGLRPGDKLAETLLARDEQWSHDLPSWTNPDGVPLRIVSGAQLSAQAIRSATASMIASAEAADLKGALTALATILPGYRPGSAVTASLKASEVMA